MIPLVGACEVIQDDNDKVTIDVFTLSSDCFQELLTSL